MKGPEQLTAKDACWVDRCLSSVFKDCKACGRSMCLNHITCDNQSDAWLCTYCAGEGGAIAKKWECCEVCHRMYRRGETCVDCPGFAESANTYLDPTEKSMLSDLITALADAKGTDGKPHPLTELLRVKCDNPCEELLHWTEFDYKGKHLIQTATPDEAEAVGLKLIQLHKLTIKPGYDDGVDWIAYKYIQDKWGKGITLTEAILKAIAQSMGVEVSA